MFTLKDMWTWSTEEAVVHNTIAYQITMAFYVAVFILCEVQISTTPYICLDSVYYDTKLSQSFVFNALPFRINISIFHLHLHLVVLIDRKPCI